MTKMTSSIQKVAPFTAADQEKLDDYYARQKALFEEIKKDIESPTQE